ncbi:MAG: glycosyltransferase family 9 protein [Chloroflexi bacterium]|nr:glycosyltransferase family 9 protein [Chloroflexota bacterium]
MIPPPSYAHPPRPQQAGPQTRVRRWFTRAAATLVRTPPGTDTEPQRLLLLRPDHLGDLLFLAPAAHWLRQQLPHAHITLAIGPWGRPALPALQGSFDEMLEVSFPAFERGERTGWARRWSQIAVLGRQWRRLNFDTALVFRPDHWWGAMVCAVAGIPRRWGFDTPETTPWLSRALAYPHEHAAASNLRLVQCLTDADLDLEVRHQPLRFEIDADLRQQAHDMLANLAHRPDHPLVIIHPGAGAAVKLWPPEQWGQVARQMGEQGATVLITGGPGEEALTAQVASSAPRALDLGGRTSFGLLAALMQQACLVMGVDSGPLHLATAVGTTTVHLYGPADAVRYGPWGDPARHIVLRSNWQCAPCQKLDWTDVEAHGCVRDIPVASVLAAAQHSLTRTSS